MSTPDPAMFLQLRGHLLSTDPETVGLARSERFPEAWGLMMETAYPQGAVSLVALADGTTSLYFSNGGGIIGGGEHQHIARASITAVGLLQTFAADMPVEAEAALPGPGHTIIRALGYAGHRSIEAAEDDLGYGRHQLSPVFHAVHRVIAMVSETTKDE
ncbi:hypothetical protein F4553_002286 [Allocatelliglobosispora scoriae]|uniref:Uncharacterized protein n=1 Tax=Allocatelliglobosispora scoriae TaxID=643052 RepID=A0A841BIF9_9ACTN|nr:hypothetical protein [Allocatelliglobosispora scoriae]MBB5868907.1 hypothetical protein [Allocatelliglobosispora scoriae]